MFSSKQLHFHMFLLAALLLFLRLRVDAYSLGAPDVACSAMTPGHGQTIQSSQPPYRLTTNSTETFGGGRIVVKLESQSVPFKGFLIQGRDPITNKAVGIFHTGLHKTLTCGSGVNNAVTHSGPDEKNTVTLEWEAPADFEGEVQFRATVVKEYVTYWTGLTSDIVSVAKRSVPFESASTSTTTTTSAPRPSGSEASMDDMYKGCGLTKTCYGPGNCVDRKNCKFMVTYTAAGNEKYEFELVGEQKDRRYVAVGLSDDESMGSDSVTVCASLEGGKFDVFHTWNDGRTNKIVARPKEGLNVLETKQVNGKMYCRFYRDSKTRISNHDFDLQNEKYHVLLAEGNIDQDGRLQYHGQNSRIVSASPISLGVTSKLEQRDTRVFKVIHGSLMIGAWIMAASCGIIFARYFKQTWLNYKCCNLDQWFHCHRFCMIFTWCCTMTALIIIAIEVRDFRPSNHSIIGIVSIGLCFIQPFMAALRPHPGTKNRWVFNWAHWFVGNSAQILGITAIFLGFEIFLGREKHWVKDLAWYVLVIFIAFHCLTHIILSITQCFSDRKKNSLSDMYPLKELSGSRVPLQTDNKRMDAPHGCFRKFILTVYLLINWCITALLIILVVVEREDLENQLKEWKIPEFWENY